MLKHKFSICSAKVKFTLFKAGVFNLFLPGDPLIDRETEQGPTDKKTLEKMLCFKTSQLFLTYFILSHYHICKK